MNYYEDLRGSSPRWDGRWVGVLPIPDRYPQDLELLELQQTVMSHLRVHTTAYEVVSGLRATMKGNLLTISEGVIWCAIGQDYYIHIPTSKVVVPQVGNHHSLGIELAKGVVGAGYDPILGGIHPLLWEAPHDRLEVHARYVWDTNDTLPVLMVGGGRLYYYHDRVKPLQDSLIRAYMRELDGDYIVSGVEVCSEGGWVHVGVGKAWVGGTPIEVEAQSLPYKDGTLQLCSDGQVVIEVSHKDYIPEYSALVDSTNTPMLLGTNYGVLLPHTTTTPYLIPYKCVPIALLGGGLVVNIAPRLPTDRELLEVLSSPGRNVAANQSGDVHHPLYRVRVTNYLPGGEHVVGGVIYLPRVEHRVSVPPYIPPNSTSILEESMVRTDWIDSSPTPSTPPPPPPFVHATPITSGILISGYNLTPGGTYTPNPAPTKVLRGTPSGASIKADAYGMLEYEALNVTDLSGVIPTAYPNLSVGLGQSFRTQTPSMVGKVSLYLRAGYYGVVSVCVIQGSLPYGPPLAWVPVSSTSTGWLDISIGPMYLPPGTYALVSQSVVGSVIGRRHYLLPTLGGTPETAGSMSMLLSQDGQWLSLPNMDLMYKVHNAKPTATYRDRFTTIEWVEAYDGYEYVSNYQLPPSTYITCTAHTKQGGQPIGKVFPPRTSMVLSEALFGTATLFPSIGVGYVILYITSKVGTWISREELVGPYTSVTVSLSSHTPQGTSVRVYLGSGSGWVEMTLVDTGTRYTYQVVNLSLTTSSTDINGAVRQVMRERVRIRIELATISPELQPYVWDVVTSTQ